MAAVATKERPSIAAEEPMRLTLDRAQFLRALGYAAAIVEARNTIPVLSNLLLGARNGELRIVSTDLNMQIALTVPANISGEGTTTVPAKLLHSIVRELPDGCQIELKLGEDWLHVFAGRSRYKLPVIPDDRFPRLKEQDASCELSLGAPDLLRAFGCVASAQDTEIIRPYCCGVCLEAHAGELTLVAMDGKRVAWSTVPVAADIELGSSILSTKVVSTLGKLLDGHEGEVRIAFDDRKATVAIGTAVLTAKLVEGTYPPWRRIIPEKPGKRLIISGASLEAAVRRVSIVANERVRAVKLELSEDKLTASCVSPEFGLATEEAPCVWDGGNFVRGFNARILLDTLAASRADELQVDFDDGPNELTLFTNPDDTASRWLLSGMRV